MFQIQFPQTAGTPSYFSKPLRTQARRCSAACIPSPSASAAGPISSTNKNHSIQSLCKKGQLKQAIHLLSQEQNPVQHTYQLLIQACAQEKSLLDAYSVHKNISDNGFDQDPFLGTKLIDMYCALGAVEDARQVFDTIRRRTIYVWNAIFRALCLSGHGEDVLVLYRRMNRIGMPSDRFTYTYALKACVLTKSKLSSLRSCKEIHAHILRDGYESHVHIMTTLVDVYAKFGCVDAANFVFSSMPLKNLVSWSAMIACLAKNGRAFDALELFRRMVFDSGDMLPNSVTIVSVLQACGALSALEQGKLIHGYILRNNLDSVLPVMNALVTMYARCGELNLGKVIFDRMDRRDVVSWNSLISGYGIHGLGSEALAVFEEMVRQGTSPSPISFVSVLGACSHSGLVEEGKMLFDSMVKIHGIVPTVEHYASLVDLLGRANRLDEAAKLITDMRDEPGPMVWGSLLGSCRIHCNVELAETASRKLFELEPKNAGNYLLLADIYEEAKLWGDAKRVMSLLEEKGLQKVYGCSWIEVKRQIYSLKSVDELNPQLEQIHSFLVNLSKEMTENGYLLETKVAVPDLEIGEKQRAVLGHSEKLAVAFGLINCSKGETIRITKNLRLCEDCHSFTKFISRFANRAILVRDINRFHHFKDGECSCGDYW